MTLPLAEKRVTDALVRLGFEVFAPRWVEQAGGRVGAMFPRYLFVRWTGYWWGITRTPGVARLITSAGSSGASAALLDDSVICGLRDVESQSLGAAPPVAVILDFKAGDAVRLGSGPFAGHVGVFRGMEAGDRVAVLLNLFGRKTAVKIAAGELEAA